MIADLAEPDNVDRLVKSRDVNDLLRHQAQLDQQSYTIEKDIRLDVESVGEK